MKFREAGFSVRGIPRQRGTPGSSVLAHARLRREATRGEEASGAGWMGFGPRPSEHGPSPDAGRAKTT